MAQIVEGVFDGRGLQIGIVVSRFNEFITKLLLEGTLNELRRSGVSESAITVVWVPGAYEIPLVASELSESGKLNGLIVLGCIVRGETSHYEHMTQSVSDEIQKVSIHHKIPVGFGILTVENMEQAMSRAGGKMGNRGRDAARTTLEMVHVLEGVRELGRKEQLIRDSFSF